MTTKQTGDTLFSYDKNGNPTNEKIHEELLAEGDALMDVDYERELAISRGMPRKTADILFNSKKMT